jgi:hypothetical protein
VKDNMVRAYVAAMFCFMALGMLVLFQWIGYQYREPDVDTSVNNCCMLTAGDHCTWVCVDTPPPKELGQCLWVNAECHQYLMPEATR